MVIALPVLVLWVALQSGGGGQGLALRLARFYTPDGATTVHAFVRVPYTLLRPVLRAADSWAAYRLTIAVTDTGGRLVTTHYRSRRVPARALAGRDGYAVERIEFVVAAGAYVCDATVVDSASGTALNVREPLAAFSQRPLLSDVILATEVHAAAARRGAAAPDELVVGRAVLREPGWPAADEAVGSFMYFAEVYAAGTAGVDSAMELSGWLESPAGARQRLDPPLVVAGEQGRQFVMGRASLSEARRGPHRMTVVARRTSDSAVRTLDLRAGVAPVLHTGQTPDPFAAMTDAQLDSLYAPLIYVMEQDERGVYAALSSAERRGFLRAFWKRRDPTPATSENEALTEFYRRVALANRDFGEGGAGAVSGWRTDRGRILILRGVPDEVLRQPQPAETLPYEVWKYTRGRPVKFAFVDLTRFGNYSLVWTNDIREVGRANWRQLLGPHAVEEVLRF